MTRHSEPAPKGEPTRDTARDALSAAIDAATLRNPLIRGEDDRQHLLVPDGFQVVDVTDPHRHPIMFARAAVAVDDSASLIAYANRHQTKEMSAIFADYDKGTICARLDWHPHNQAANGQMRAGPDRHSVTLKLRDSLEWQRWNGMAGRLHSQADFALFLEENASDIWLPEPAIFVEIARDLEAASGMKFTSRTRLQNGDMEFSFAEESRITSKVTAPEEFTLRIPLYFGESPEDVTARFRWKAQPDGLGLGFVWHRAEYMRQTRFRLIAAAVAEATGLPYYLGRTA